jgi:hypothetical protein
MKVLEISRKYLGNQELPGNKFIDDPKVEKDLGELIKKAGQNDGEAWCCYFAEAMFCEAFPEQEAKLRKLFSASCVKTFENFVRAGYTVSQKPVKGALAIYRKCTNGMATVKGHAGICEEVYSDTTYRNIEGNTTAAGVREGKYVNEKDRTTKMVATGLNLMGFIIIQ